MSRPYRWHAARYVCPECGGATEGCGGPDHIVNVRCQDCEWWESFDPAADERPKDTLATVN